MKREINIFNLNLKRLNLSAWLVLLIAFVTPFRIGESGRQMFGYPFAFLKFYGWNEARIPLIASNFDFLIFIGDIIVFYLILSGIKRFIAIMNSMKNNI